MRISEANKLIILYFLVFSCTASWLPIFADYLKDQGLTGIQIGTILSITPVMMFLVQPLYGILADRWGFKNSLLLSALFASLGFALYLLEGGFLFLFFVSIFMSLFYNALQPLLDSLSLDLGQRDPKFSYGSLRIAGAMGWAFTGVFVGYFIDYLSTTVIFAFSALSMALCFVFSFFLANAHKGTASSAGGSLGNLKDVFGNKPLLFLLLCVSLVSAGATTIWNFYSIYMKENGASATLVGYGLSFQGLCELPFFYFSARMIKRLGIKSTLILTIFATSLRMLLYGVVSNPYFAIGIELLQGLSWSLFWVVCVAYVDKLVREDRRATGQSLLYAAYFGVGAIVGNFWTGYLYEQNMRIAAIFLLNALGVAILGALVWIFMADVRDDGTTIEAIETDKGLTLP